MSGQDTLSFSQITTSTSMAHDEGDEDTPSWSTLDGLVAEAKYRTAYTPVYTPLDSLTDPGNSEQGHTVGDPIVHSTPEDPPEDPLLPTQRPLTQQPLTQSTQDTLVPVSSQPLSQQAMYSSQPLSQQAMYSSQPLNQQAVHSVERALTSSLPDKLPTPDSSFAESQQIRMERLRQELAQHEDHILTSSEQLAQLFRQHAVQALADGPEVLRDGLNTSQHLSHSILEEQSSSRLAAARPPPCYQPVSVSSVDLTPLTEDLLMNSRTDYCSDAQTISDSAFPTESTGEHQVVDVSNEIIETPLSDEEDEMMQEQDDILLRKYPELTNDSTVFSTPPRVRRALAKSRTPVELQSGGRTIGHTELGSFEDTSRASDSVNVVQSVKPLRRHAWSDSETENSSLARSIKDMERSARIDMERSARIVEDTTRSPLAPCPAAHRLQTAPSSEKIEKFELEQVKNRAALDRAVADRADRVKSRAAPDSDSSLNSKDYPNLKNSFITLQNTIMSDIAALRRELLDKQDGTEKLRSEFADFKRSYYEKSVQAVQTSPNVWRREERAKTPTPAPAPKTPVTPVITKTPVPPVSPIPAVYDEVTSYSDLDSETDRQIATLHAMQRSLREQSNERFLQDLEEHRRTKSRNETLRNETLSPAESERSETREHSEGTREHSEGTREHSEGTREVFMDILRQKAEQDEENVKQKRLEEKELRKEEDKENERSVRHAAVQSFTPSPAAQSLRPAVQSPRPAAPQSATPRARQPSYSESTLSVSSTDTYTLEEEEGPDLNALWKEFMRYVVQSKALKPKSKQKKKRRQEKKPVPATPAPALAVATPAPPPPAPMAYDISPPPAVQTPAPTLPAPTAFDISPPDLKTSKFFTGLRDESCLTRDERIQKLKEEIEEERRQRQQQRDIMKEQREQVEERAQEKAAQEKARAEEKPKVEKAKPPVKEVEEVPVRDTDVECPPPPRPKALAFDVSFDLVSQCSTEVERAPGYPNMVFKSGRLQDAFQHRMHGFMEKSTRRAIHVQLRKEARQRYSNSTPPLRPRATMDPDHFTRFDIPPPRVRLISARQARSHSRKIYQSLPEVTTKQDNNKVERQRETYRLRAKLFNKKVQGHVLGRRPFHALQVY